MDQISQHLLAKSIQKDIDLTPAERDQLTPDALMILSIEYQLTDSERAKLSSILDGFSIET